MIDNLNCGHGGTPLSDLRSLDRIGSFLVSPRPSGAQNSR